MKLKANDIQTDITNWQVKTNARGPLLSSGGGGSKIFKWQNPGGQTGTQLQLIMKPGLGIDIFGVTVKGSVSCQPTPPPSPAQPPPPPAQGSLSPVVPSKADGSIDCVDSSGGA